MDDHIYELAHVSRKHSEEIENKVMKMALDFFSARQILLNAFPCNERQISPEGGRPESCYANDRTYSKWVSPLQVDLIAAAFVSAHWAQGPKFDVTDKPEEALREIEKWVKKSG